MIDPLPCQACAFANAPGAATCASCGAALAETPERVHPGETLRDPDDLTLPPSPLLRAVLRGEPGAFTYPAGAAAPAAPTTAAAAGPAPPIAAAPTAPPAVSRPSVEPLSPSADHAALLRDLAERLHTRKAEPAVHYAGFFVRAVAFLVDGVVLGAFALPLAAAGYWGMIAGMMVLGHATAIAPDETLVTLLLGAWFAMATAYFTILHGSDGRTIGKALLGITVRTIQLHPVGLTRALVRTIAYAFSSSFFGFGFFLVALTPRKRGWHDFLAGTCVVRLPPGEVSA